MRTAAALMMAALALPAAAALAAPAAAQTRAQTYAIGPSDFLPSTTTRRDERRSASDPAYYEDERAPAGARVIDCGRSADPRCFDR